MKLYTCEYCYNEFEPARRRVQKYCSNSCRSKAYHLRKTNTKKLPSQTLDSKINLLKPIPSKTKIDNMSASGVGNAAVGSLLADGIKSIVTADKNKAATKGDIAELKALFNKRYLPIKNMPLNGLGRLPYYDVSNESVVYLD